MKKLLAALLLLTLTATAALSFAEGAVDQLDRILERGELVIATEGNWSPWTYHDEQDVLTGFDIAVGNLIAEKLGVKATFRETEWSALLAGVDSGLFDLACNGVGYTKVRAQKYAFSDPYAYTEVALVVRKDNEDIKSFEDLAGRTTSNSPGSTYATIAEDAGATVTYVDALNETLLMVEQGRVDASINALGSIEDYLGEHPDANLKIVLVAPGEPVAIPMRKTTDKENTDALVARVNEILAEAREDGTLRELSVQFFGKDLTEPAR